MSVNLTSPLTGSTITGFTSPTYTLTADTSIAPNGKQWAVTALGGTQANVDTHSIAKPFTIAYFKQAIGKTLGQLNPLTGLYKGTPPRNKDRLVTRKGVNCAANVPDIAYIRTELDFPAGADTYEPEDLKAAISAHIGALSQLSAGIADTKLTGIM